MMTLEALSIFHQYDGTFSINVRFKDQNGEIKMRLPDSFNQRILALCADELQAAVERAAHELTREVIEGAQAALPEAE